MLLVIEPVEDVRELLVRFLARHGLRATGCIGPADASPWLRGGRVEVVIVSHDHWVGLPYSCSELRDPRAPETIVLGTGPLDENELARRLGSFFCLQMKPFEPWQLYAAVLEAERRRQSGPHARSGILVSEEWDASAVAVGRGGNRGMS